MRLKRQIKIVGLNVAETIQYLRYFCVIFGKIRLWRNRGIQCH